MSGILITDFVLILMIFLRVVSAIVVAPVYGNSVVPGQVKVFLSIVISYIIFMTMDKSSVVIEVSLGWMIFNGIKEVLTGMLLGYMLNFVFYGLSFAASLIGFSIGLSMAQAFNPLDELSDNIIGEIYGYIAILVLFIINGHHYIITGLFFSFKTISIGHFAITKPVFDLIVKYSFSVFIIAVKISAPIIVSVFVVQIAEGVVARMIPQMQVFFVTQPLKIAFGIFLLISAIPITVYLMKVLLKETETGLYNLINAMV
jgi:flagellar biosynthetic protein FliR